MRLSEIRLFGDRVLVRPDVRDPLSDGGAIQIPDSVLSHNPNYYSMTGTVVRIGDGVAMHEWQCRHCGRIGPEHKGACPGLGCGWILQVPNLVLWASGPKRPLSVHVGDRILYNRYSGKQLDVTGQRTRLLLMREHEVYGLVEGAHRIRPGYEAPKWGKPTEGLTI